MWRPWLQAQEEQQMLAQIEQQLHKARQQLEHQRKQHSVSGAAVQQGVPAAKCCVALQERLSQKKQQLDEAVSRWGSATPAVEAVSSRAA
jgi:capsule polysaccharide export protein KpsE/RkpR